MPSTRTRRAPRPGIAPGEKRNRLLIASGGRANGFGRGRRLEHRHAVGVRRVKDDADQLPLAVEDPAADAPDGDRRVDQSPAFELGGAPRIRQRQAHLERAVGVAHPEHQADLSVGARRLAIDGPHRPLERHEPAVELAGGDLRVGGPPDGGEHAGAHDGEVAELDLRGVEPRRAGPLDDGGVADARAARRRRRAGGVDEDAVGPIVDEQERAPAGHERHHPAQLDG